MVVASMEAVCENIIHGTCIPSVILVRVVLEYFPLFSSREYSENGNSSSVTIVEMFSTGQVTARAMQPYKYHSSERSEISSCHWPP